MVEAPGDDPALLRAITRHIEADARWVAFIARRMRILGPAGHPAPLHGGGTLEHDSERQVLRLAHALQDLRRRRLNPHAPIGWPILSLEQRSLLVTSQTAAAGGRLTIAGDRARELGRLLLVTHELARVDWAEPYGDGGSAVAASGGRGR